eukprot:g4050.t1
MHKIQHSQSANFVKEENNLHDFYSTLEEEFEKEDEDKKKRKVDEQPVSTSVTMFKPEPPKGPAPPQGLPENSTPPQVVPINSVGVSSSSSPKVSAKASAKEEAFFAKMKDAKREADALQKQEEEAKLSLLTETEKIEYMKEKETKRKREEQKQHSLKNQFNFAKGKKNKLFQKKKKKKKKHKPKEKSDDGNLAQMNNLTATTPVESHDSTTLLKEKDTKDVVGNESKMPMTKKVDQDSMATSSPLMETSRPAPPSKALKPPQPIGKPPSLDKLSGLPNKVSGLPNKASGLPNTASGLPNKVSESQQSAVVIEEDVGGSSTSLSLEKEVIGLKSNVKKDPYEQSQKEEEVPKKTKDKSPEEDIQKKAKESNEKEDTGTESKEHKKESNGRDQKKISVTGKGGSPKGRKDSPSPVTKPPTPPPLPALPSHNSSRSMMNVINKIRVSRGKSLSQQIHHVRSSGSNTSTSSIGSSFGGANNNSSPVRALSGKLLTVEKEYKSYKLAAAAEIKTLEQKLDEKSRNLELRIIEVEQSESKYSLLEKNFFEKKKTFEQNIKALENQLQEQRDENASLKAKSKSGDPPANASAESNNALKRKVIELEILLEQKNHEIQSKDKILDNHVERIAQMKLEGEKQVIALSSARAELTKSQAIEKSLRNQLETKISGQSSFESEVKTLRETNAELQAELDSLQSAKDIEVAKANKAMQGLQDEINSEKMKVTVEHRKALDLEEEQKSSLEHEKHVQQEMTKLKSKIAELTVNLKQNTNSLENVQDKYTNAQVTHEHDVEVITMLQKHSHQGDAKRQELREKIKELESDVFKTKEKYAQNLDELERAKVQIETLSKSLSKQQEIVNLKEATIHDFKMKFEKSLNDVRHLRQDLVNESLAKKNLENEWKDSMEHATQLSEKLKEKDLELANNIRDHSIAVSKWKGELELKNMEIIKTNNRLKMEHDQRVKRYEAEFEDKVQEEAVKRTRALYDRLDVAKEKLQRLENLGIHISDVRPTANGIAVRSITSWY